MSASSDERGTWQRAEGTSALCSAPLLLCRLVTKSGTELLPPRFSASTSFFPLQLQLLVLLSPSCPYSFHLSSFFTHHFDSVILPFLCLQYLLPALFHFPSHLYFHPPLFLCLPSLHLFPLLSNPVFNSLTLPPSFPSLCQSCLSVSPFPPHCFFLFPPACCII